jgi:hypothetical protein
MQAVLSNCLAVRHSWSCLHVRCPQKPDQHYGALFKWLQPLTWPAFDVFLAGCVSRCPRHPAVPPHSTRACRPGSSGIDPAERYPRQSCVSMLIVCTSPADLNWIASS